MSHWKEYKLGDIADVIMGQSPPGESCNNIGKGIPLLNGPTEFSVKYPIPIQFTANPKKLSKVDDILFCVRGSTTGRMNWSDREYAIGRGLAAIRHKKGNEGQYFIKGLLDYLLPSILGSATGSTFPNVSGEELRNLDVIAPDFPEQTTIAKVLSSLDDKVDLLYRQNKTLEAMAETLFRQWFAEEAEENWEEKCLDEIAVYLNGLALQKYPSDGINFLPVIKIREMKQGISENTDKCSKNIPKQYIIIDGDILFSWSGSLEVVIWHDGEGALNQHLFKVTSDKYPKWFYYLATKYHLPGFRSIAESKTTTMGHIQREHLRDAFISIPPNSLFFEYDKQLSPIIDKIISNNSQIRTLIQLRDTLLPKLMSGEVSVKMN